MKIFRKLIVSVFFVGISVLVFSQQLSLMSFNIRYDNPADGVHRWDERKHAVVDFILSEDVGVVGIQEGLCHQLSYLDSCLTDFKYVGVGRDDGARKGEFCAVFYDTTKYSVVTDETFWLSKTPDRVSVGWDASMERICTCVLFEDKLNSTQFVVYNLHLDHVSAKARRKSVSLVLKYADEMKNLPCFILGDFNATSKEVQIRKLFRRYGDLMSCDFNGPIGTFHDFGRAENEGRIDYIFTNRKLNCVSYSHLKVNYKKGLFLSDHRPVKAVFEL